MGHQATIFTYRHDPVGCYPQLSREVDIRAVVPYDGSLARVKSHWVWYAATVWRRYVIEARAVARLVQERFDVLNPHERPAHRTAIAVKRKWGRPIVWMHNDPASWETGYYAESPLPRPLFWLKSKWLRSQERKLVRQIDAVTVLDHRVQRLFQREYGVLPRVVRTGLDKEFLLEPINTDGLRAKLQLPPSSAFILFVGILRAHQRVEDLLAAFHILCETKPAARLIILGSPTNAPDYYNFLKAETARLGIENNVVFVPRSVSEEDLRAYYRACDIFAFPNEEQTWGLAPLEAMICGKPVVVSTGAGVHEVLKDRETALLVPPRRPDLIAAAIASLLDDASMYGRLAVHGREFVLRELSWRRYAEQMLAAFQETIAGCVPMG